MNPRVVRAVREHAQIISEAASDTFVMLTIADGFVEPGTTDEAFAALPEAIRTSEARSVLRELASLRAAVRIVAVGEDFAWAGVYHAERHVPEQPVAWACIAPAETTVTRFSAFWVFERRFAGIASAFPSLRGAPGVHPININALARWALSQPLQTASAAACAIELGAGLRHEIDGPVVELFETLPGGLSQMPFDDAHCRALCAAARMVGRTLPARQPTV